MKKLYNKIAPVITKISLVGLLVGLLAFLIPTVMLKSLTEPWPIFYASIAKLIGTYVLWVFGALLVVFNFRVIWVFLRELIRKCINEKIPRLSCLRRGNNYCSDTFFCLFISARTP